MRDNKSLSVTSNRQPRSWARLGQLALLRTSYRDLAEIGRGGREGRAGAQMRHSRASTTLDIYQQFVPESQRLVVDKLTGLSGSGKVN